MAATRIVSIVFLLSLCPRPGDAVAPPSNLEVVDTGDGWARFRWDVSPDPSARGYRLKYSLTPGTHPSMTDWNGYPAAFTFSTDDGTDDNLVYMNVFDNHGVPFTAFVMPLRFGWDDHLTAAEVETLHAHGHEVGSHTEDHKALVRNTALTLTYVDTAGSCVVEVEDDTLRTVLNGMEEDVEIQLADAEVRYLYQLVAYLDSLPAYECTLDSYPCESGVCLSDKLTASPPVEIAGSPATLLTSRGCDSTTMIYEISEA